MGPLRGLIVGPSGWAPLETEITFMASLHRPTGANPETIVLTGMSQNKRLMSEAVKLLILHLPHVYVVVGATNTSRQNSQMCFEIGANFGT